MHIAKIIISYENTKGKNSASFAINNTIFEYLCSINILRFSSRIIGWRWQ